ncbi:MAG TPA: bifunctional ornithine acetyltransferase/N-acetylglutamate synthase, partial [Victivallales bacterium]|nr:bifunctional ornithine acetyltransferase/N-acetylglutamate synthase [Victivallales bacterium]
GIDIIAKNLSAKNASDAAEAIMTTDLVKKEAAIVFKTFDGKEIFIGSMTKGSGMISPKMQTFPHATMLSFISCDALVEKNFLRKVFDECIQSTFNKITVDNDMSTNDTVIMFCNGAATNKLINENSPDAANFAEALRLLMEKMAKSIVLDGEGVTKFVTVIVENAANREDAEKCARAIANSMLCKTAWFGGDPNWGRILAAAGYSGAEFSPEKVDLLYNDKFVIKKGKPEEIPEKELAEEVAKKEFVIKIRLGAGKKNCTIWTSDLSYDYVKINADYRT